jgi:predicted XRE-type DNA-binding protein
MLQQKINDLNLVMTQSSIADFVGCSQVTISDLSRGRSKSTTHDYGKRIEMLHRNKRKAIQSAKRKGS